MQKKKEKKEKEKKKKKSNMVCEIFKPILCVTVIASHFFRQSIVWFG